MNRDLTEHERNLAKWLLENGEPGADSYLQQLDRATVFRQCSCGCDSIDFSIDNRIPHDRRGLEILSGYFWQTADGKWLGIFVFASHDHLAGLEVWSVDGTYEKPPTLPPSTDVLRPKAE